MYGTVMIGELAAPFDKVQAISKAWEAERGGKATGYLGESVMLADDGKTVVVAVRFKDKETYRALGDDPEQDRWWREEMAPCFAGEVRWIDGTWHD